MLVGVTDTAPDVWPAVANFVLVHEVAFVEDHVSWEEPLPRIIELGLALSSAVGDAAMDTELLQD